MGLKEAYRALDPAHPLGPAAAAYVARPDNPVSRIITELQLTDTPRQYLLTGHRGTGKTTELSRVSQALADDYQVRMVTIGASGFSPSEVADMLQAASSTQRSLLLIDGVDKLEIHAATGVLRELVDLQPMAASTICTIPLALSLTDDFGNIAQSFDSWSFLPAIDLWGRDGERIEAGWELCREILRRRADVFDDSALEVLVGNGAGIHRELLRLAQRACVLAVLDGHDRVGMDHAFRAVHELRNEYSIMLRSRDIELLRQVDRTGQLSGDIDLLRLVRDQFVVVYASGGTWFDVHPIVRPLISAQREVASG